MIDFAHLHAATDGGFLETKPSTARSRGRDPRQGSAVPHPLQRHRVREPERDEAPALRRGDAPRGAASGGAREVQAAGDGDQRVAGRGVVSGDPVDSRGERSGQRPAGAASARRRR